MSAIAREPLLANSDHGAPAAAVPSDLSDQPYPAHTAIGFWSVLWFSWVWPVLQRGHSGPITPRDLYRSPPHMTAAHYVPLLSDAYKRTPSTKTGTRLMWAIVRAFKEQYFLRLWVWRMVLLALTIVRPAILRQLLLLVSSLFIAEGSDINNDDQWTILSMRLASVRSITEPLYWAVSLSIVSLLMAILNHHFWWIGVQLALSVRGAVIGLVYRKSVTLHSRHRAEYPSGRISNLTSVDGDSMMNFMWGAVHEIWSAPLLIVLLVIGLLWELGVAALVGVATLILSLLITSSLARRMSHLQDQIMKTSDERVSKISETLTSIKLIKLYSWQFAFADTINGIRQRQESLLYRSTAIGALTRCLGLASPLFVSFASFATYIALGHDLDAATTFTSLLLFQQLKEPMGKLPEAISSLVKCLISQRRILEFLECSDQEDYVITSESKGKIEIVGGEFDWGQQSQSGSHQSNFDDPHAHSPLNHAHADANNLPSPMATIDSRLHSARSDGSEHAPSIALTEITARPWNSASNSVTPPILHDINLAIAPGSLTMIVGAVGSGKSSLLQCMLGEMHRRRGSVSVSPRIAYTAQVSFLQSATIRDNILFGQPMDATYYRATIQACALEDDLSRFADGDLTLIGENGITLSGGQKHRVSLARAVYSRADIFLFDEPLGAVDAHVGLHLFEHIMSNTGLLSDRTRILVTHQLQFAPRVDDLIVMDNGTIKQRGSYAKLQAAGVDFRAIVESAHTGDASEREKREAEEQSILKQQRSPHQLPINSRASSVPSSPAMLGRSQSNGSTGYVDESNDAVIPAIQSGTSTNQPPSSSTLSIVHSSTTGARDLTDESLNVTAMSRDTYIQYFRSGASAIVWLTVLLLVLSSQAAIVFSDYLLAWVSTAGVEEENGLSPTETQFGYLRWYLLCVAVATFLLLARTLSIALISTRAGARLHRRLFYGLLRAPQWFHDSTPSGRILNRVGKDMNMIDSQLPGVIQDIFSCAVAVAGTILLTVVITPLSLPLLAVVFGLYLWIQRHYRPASVAMKRLESVTRSPMYQHVQASCTGIVTLRAFQSVGSMDREYHELKHRLDLNTRVYFYSFAVHRWMGLRLEALGALVVLISSVVALFLLPTLSPGLVGLVITTSLSLSGQLHWLVRQRTELEVQLNAVERILEYASLVPEEDDQRFAVGYQFEKQLLHQASKQRSHPPSQDDHYVRLDVSDEPTARTTNAAPSTVDSNPRSSAMLIPPASWPQRGLIQFHNVSVAYRSDGPVVLHNVNATVQPGEKIGIVGRTGAGKSTLSLALFRLMEAKHGYITIDDLPLHRIPLHILRSRLSLIPQDSVLFAASIRSNLDPFHRHSDERLWRVVDKIGLTGLVQSMGSGLSSMVSDAGENLSLGQRQLLCLGRALLRESKILVMDEATAALDLQCDQVMKTVIAENFRQCTIITIAHRLNSVLGSDRIMVFDAGQLKELDSPAKLIQRGGLLKQLLDDASVMTKEMREGNSHSNGVNGHAHGSQQKLELADDSKEGDTSATGSAAITRLD